MVRNAVLFDQCDEVRGRVPGQRGFREVFVRGNEIFWRAMNIGEIAAAAAGDENFLPDAIGMFKHRDAPPAFAGLNRAEESLCTPAKNQSVKVMNQECISLLLEFAVR
jgi:hypothetical protein